MAGNAGFKIFRLSGSLTFPLVTNVGTKPQHNIESMTWSLYQLSITIYGFTTNMLIWWGEHLLAHGFIGWHSGLDSALYLVSAACTMNKVTHVSGAS